MKTTTLYFNEAELRRLQMWAEAYETMARMNNKAQKEQADLRAKLWEAEDDLELEDDLEPEDE